MGEQTQVDSGKGDLPAAGETESGEPGERMVDLGALPSFLGYAIRRAQLTISDDFNRTLAAVDLRPAYFYTLLVIQKNPGLNQSDVSAALGIQRTNFVVMVNELEGRGLIERRPSASDRRSYALHLTRKGRALLARAMELQAEHQARFVSVLGADEHDRLIRLLGKLAESHH